MGRLRDHIHANPARWLVLLPLSIGVLSGVYLYKERNWSLWWVLGFSMWLTVQLQILIRNRLDGKTQHERRIEYASRWLGVEGAKSVLEGKDGEPRGTLSSAYKDIMAGPISSARETERRFEEAQEREARRLGDSEKHKKGAKKGRKKDR